MISSSSPSSGQSNIYVSAGCMLIPVFVIAWFYYTKRACRKMAVGLLKNRQENNENDGCSSIDFSMMEAAYYNQEQQQL